MPARDAINNVIRDVLFSLSQGYAASASAPGARGRSAGIGAALGGPMLRQQIMEEKQRKDDDFALRQEQMQEAARRGRMDDVMSIRRDMAINPPTGAGIYPPVRSPMTTAMGAVQQVYPMSPEEQEAARRFTSETGESYNQNAPPAPPPIPVEPQLPMTDRGQPAMPMRDLPAPFVAGPQIPGMGVNTPRIATIEGKQRLIEDAAATAEQRARGTYQFQQGVQHQNAIDEDNNKSLNLIYTNDQDQQSIARYRADPNTSYQLAKVTVGDNPEHIYANYDPRLHRFVDFSGKVLTDVKVIPDAQRGQMYMVNTETGKILGWANPLDKKTGLVTPEMLGINEEITRGATTAEILKMRANAWSGLDALAKLRGELKKPNALALLAIPYGVGARVAYAARNEMKDVVTRLRTGAALNTQEQAFYDEQVPGLLDALFAGDAEAIDYKLSIFENNFRAMTGGKPRPPRSKDDYVPDPNNLGETNFQPKLKGRVAAPPVKPVTSPGVFGQVFNPATGQMENIRQ